MSDLKDCASGWMQLCGVLLRHCDTDEVLPTVRLAENSFLWHLNQTKRPAIPVHLTTDQPGISEDLPVHLRGSLILQAIYGSRETRQKGWSTHQ